MENIVTHISSYIQNISRQYNLSISFHTFGKYTSIFDDNPQIAFYGIHKSPYCTKIKSNPKRKRKCHLCQQFIKKKCEICPSFIGICHADITEYIHRIEHDGKVIGFISVSGYRAENSKFPKDSEYTYLYNISTKSCSPDEKLLNVIIPPLKYMLEKYIADYDFYKINKNKEYYEILNYINENFYNITLDELCRHFCRSKSYISHLFKKNNGQSIRQYANSLKIYNAKILLKTTDASVTDIAAACGFNELEYFITTFKKATNESPLKYRKRNREE